MKLEIQNNAVMKDGQLIGIIHDGTCYSPEAIAGPIKGKIRQLPGAAELKFVVGDMPTPDEKSQQGARAVQPPAVHPLSDAALLAEMQRRGLVPSAPVAAAAIPSAPLAPTSAVPQPQEDKHSEKVAMKIAVLDRLNARVEAGEIPAPPAQLPEAGDKTPAYVDWARAHLSPADFETVYGGRKLPKSVAEIERAAQAHMRALNKQDSELTKGAEILIG